MEVGATVCTAPCNRLIIGVVGFTRGFLHDQRIFYKENLGYLYECDQ